MFILDNDGIPVLTRDAQVAFGFVIAQGRNLETGIYRRRYPSFDYAAHVPVVTERSEWAIGTQFRLMDHTGQAKFINGKANDMPFGKSTMELGAHDFAMIGAGWEWSDEEVAQAQLYAVNLRDDDALAAIEDVERLLYAIATTGAAEKSWTGLVNSASVQRADAATAGGSTFWADKDVDEMAADVNAGLEAVRANSNEVEWADTVRIPPAAFRIAATRRVGAGDGTLSVLEYIRQNNIYTAETGQALDLAPLRELASASNDGGGRLIAYRKDPQVLRFHLPMPRKVLQPYRASLMGYQQGVIARTGGTEIRLPSAMAYVDEITDVPA
jgi:hypothetical protein